VKVLYSSTASGSRFWVGNGLPSTSGRSPRRPDVQVKLVGTAIAGQLVAPGSG